MSSRAQNYEFQDWWNKQREFLDKPENTAFLTVEIHSPTVDKGHTRSARQLSWLWLLKFQQLATSLAWLTDGFIDLLRTANRRIAASKTDSPSDSSISSRLYRIIKYFLFLVIMLLCVELIAYLKGWHFSPPSVELAEAAVERAYAKKLRPAAAAEYVGRENVEDYPMVLVQIPMCNEREGKDDLALVQARWAFVNKDENLLTRLQNINLSFHFEVEQQVNGVFINFFGFNGTAGVWRIKALEDCGGWLERTTVEDMDIAVRAHLCGWKFIYLNDVKCLCELPESYEAYKKQQHRWHSGPMQLFPHPAFLFIHSLLHHSPTYHVLPEAQLPAWVVCYVPGIMSILNILPGPRSFLFIVPYLLFENTMSVTKFNAMISGLFRLGSSYEWVVTKKLGRSSEADLVALAEKESDPVVVETTSLHRSSSESGLDELNKIGTTKKTGKKKRNRLYRKELALALILLTASLRSLLSAQGIHFYFLLFQGISFLVVGLDLIGE
ncbi:hypothetical protein NC651_032970 [Populus alba x Populus x berolinensis]|nr:hypothetical protein NC651_032970 [Populus alba x Populus x berolinensis]